MNASLRTPHVNYPFSLSPESKAEFIHILMNLEHYLKSHIVNKATVEHFFDLHHLRTSVNLLYGDIYSNLLEYSGGYLNHFTSPLTLEFWLKHIRGTYYEKILIRSIHDFMKSDKYFLRSIQND